jgi:hypothetical protein
MSVMIWSARSTLVPRCSLIPPNLYTTITLHHLIHFAKCVRVRNVGWTTWACQLFSAAPTLFEPLVPFKHCCTLQLSHLRMDIHWSCTFHTKKLQHATLCVSGRIHNCLLYNTQLGRHDTKQPAYDMCLSWSVVKTVGDWTKITQYKLSAYLSYNPYTMLLYWFWSSAAICLNGTITFTSNTRSETKKGQLHHSAKSQILPVNSIITQLVQHAKISTFNF